jgi:FlaA1/EpsC-like NDP-sugar epimerase
MGDGGEIFVLDMGNPVRIVDLARDLITLSGLRPDVDIKIEFVGIRPGEKLFEELATTCEQATKTRHPKIFVGRFRQYGWEQVCQKIAELEALADASQDEIRSKYAELVPEYRSGRPIRKSMVGSPLARVVKTA